MEDASSSPVETLKDEKDELRALKEENDTLRALLLLNNVRTCLPVKDGAPGQSVLDKSVVDLEVKVHQAKISYLMLRSDVLILHKEVKDWGDRLLQNRLAHGW